MEDLFYIQLCAALRKPERKLESALEDYFYKEVASMKN